MAEHIWEPISNLVLKCSSCGAYRGKEKKDIFAGPKECPPTIVHLAKEVMKRVK